MKVMRQILTRVTPLVLLSIGRGMVLYLDMAQALFERCPRMLFLCTYYMNEMYMLTLHVYDPIRC